MLPTRGWIALSLLLLTLAAAVLALLERRAYLTLDAPPPRVLPEPVDTLPRAPLSVVDAPVLYELRPILDSLEAAVPRTYGDLARRIPSRSNRRLSYAIRIRRSPFRLVVRGTTAIVSADVDYAGHIWYRTPLGPTIALSCGTDARPPRARLTVMSTGRLTRDWGVRTDSRVLELAAFSDSARDHCRVSFLRIDVTGEALGRARAWAATKLAEFDGKVARWPARRSFETMWRDVQKPIRLADSLYLTIHPQDLEVGPIRARDGFVSADLHLLTRPRITSGPRPSPAMIPLPPMRRARAAADGARVVMDGSMTYPIASLYLRRSLVGRGVRQAGRLIRIRDLVLYGIGGGRVALGVTLAGAVRGRVFFTGTPRLDARSGEIEVPDLSYDVGTARMLVKGYEWLSGTDLRDTLRARARVPDSTVMARLAQLADRGMNRRLPAQGTRVAGHVGRARTVAVRAGLGEMRVRALADANLRLVVWRAPRIPRPPRPGAPPGGISARAGTVRPDP